MDYVKGIFKNRPNRFIAEVEVDGEMEIAHVPNTGRCKELLVDDAVVWLKPSDNPNRKTKFSLHFVENKNVLVSLFSQQANSIVYDAIVDGKIKELAGYNHHKREKTVDNSRIDIYLENENEKCYVEVKGVTLIVDGEARFPDKPEERDVLYFIAQSFRGKLLQELPKDKQKIGKDTKFFEHRAKAMIKELASINTELAQMVVASDEDESLPDWFMLEVVRDLPRLVTNAE